jgi:hypothetical protein
MLLPIMAPQIHLPLMALLSVSLMLELFRKTRNRQTGAAHGTQL